MRLLAGLPLGSMALAACGPSAPAASSSTAPTAGTAAPAAQTAMPVSVAASTTSVDHIWGQWGVIRDIYPKYGFDVTVVDNVSDPVSALAAGQIQFAAAGVASQSGAVRGAPVRVQAVTFRDNLGLFTAPDLTSVDQLRGKKVIGPNDMIKQVLRAKGLDPDNDITWVNAQGSTAQMIALVQQGAADGFASYPPAGPLAQRAGLNQLVVTSDVYPGVPVSVVATSVQIMTGQPDMVKRFLSAVLDIEDDLKANKDAVVDFMVSNWSFDQDLATAAYAPIENDLVPNGIPPDSALQVALDVTRKGANITTDLKLTDVWDFTLLREVLASRPTSTGGA